MTSCYHLRLRIRSTLPEELVRAHLAGQLAGNSFFQAAQHEGAQNLVQAAGDQQHLLLLQVALHAKPALEVLAGAEQRGHQEIQQRPELIQFVLNRRACTM